MGLDMFLFKANKGTKGYEKVAYWRKANQIRKWFVDKCGYPDDADCKYYKVTKKQLKDLKKTCKRVIKEPNLAEELLPTQSGFFFGDTEYNNFYFEDLEDTREMLKKVIKETDWENEEVFYYEWW